MLQPSPLKEILSRDLGRQGVVKHTGRKLCFIDYDLFTTALSPISTVPTVITLLARILNHLDLKVFSSGCSQHAFPQIDFWITLTVQNQSLILSENCRASLLLNRWKSPLQNRCKSPLQWEGRNSG